MDASKRGILFARQAPALESIHQKSPSALLFHHLKPSCDRIYINLRKRLVQQLLSRPIGASRKSNLRRATLERNFCVGRIKEPKMLRTIVERLSRGKSMKRRLPSQFGRTPLYVSPDARLRYLKPGKDAFDNELFRIIHEHIREDTVVWDIGANVGLFAFGAASVAKKGSVLAVEADVWLAQLMRKSLQLKENCGLNLQVLPCAIADKNGVATFLIANRGRASNALEVLRGRSQSGGVRETATVPTLTLDTLLDFFSPPSFVKIDVEGAEAMVLRGAARLLSEIRPIIHIEVGREANEEVTFILHKAGYELFDGSIPIHEQKPVSFCAFSTLARSQESVNAQHASPADPRT